MEGSAHIPVSNQCVATRRGRTEFHCIGTGRFSRRPWCWGKDRRTDQKAAADPFSIACLAQPCRLRRKVNLDASIPFSGATLSFALDAPSAISQRIGIWWATIRLPGETVDKAEKAESPRQGVLLQRRTFARFAHAAAPYPTESTTFRSSPRTAMPSGAERLLIALQPCNEPHRCSTPPGSEL